MSAIIISTKNAVNISITEIDSCTDLQIYEMMYIVIVVLFILTLFDTNVFSHCPREDKMLYAQTTQI